MMKRLKWLSLCGLLIGASAWAQPNGSSQITIGINVAGGLANFPGGGTNYPGGIGPAFIVDGTVYNSAQTFFWPLDSEHFVSFPLSNDGLGGTLPYQASPYFPARYFFGSWVQNSGLLVTPGALTQTIIATPAVTSLIASVTVQYPIYIAFDPTGVQDPTPNCTGIPPNSSPGVSGSGVMYLDGTCYAGNTTLWAPAGPHTIQALPFPGWAFAGWMVSPGAVQPFVAQITTTQGTTITPSFQPAKRVEFRTNPVGLSLLVDTSTIQTPPTTQIDGTDTSTCIPNYTLLSGIAPPGFTPLCIGDFDWLPGSQHAIGALTPQMDAGGNIWTFEGFSTGQGQNSVYTANQALNTIDVVTANFVRAIRVTFTTYPSGLPLTVDGRTNPIGLGFFWGAGDTHTVSAPPIDTDAQGRQWAFVSWSNQGPATQTISPTTDLTLSATYAELGQLQLTSSPSGLTFTADGSPCVTPCTVNRPSGTQIQVIAPASTGQTQGSRYQLVSWTDGATSLSRQVTFTTGVQSLAVVYQASFLLSTASNPAGGATLAVAPSSPDGYYPQGTPVVISAAAKNGYKFTAWGGDLSGALSPGYLTMDSPHTVIAELTQVPYLAPTGIESVAGPTLDGSVAPGSLIAIYGSNLAAAVQSGPSSPLAQAIGGTTVTIGSDLLPLIFVSPQQINAQLPSNLPDGNYTLTVQNVGQADVTGTVTVSRDAPALYTQTNAQNQPLVMAYHQDGTPITFSSPALRNETITIFTTGFGPLNPILPDGFAAPASPAYQLVDPVMINLGGSLQLTPNSATAAPGLVGTSILKLTITDAIPKAATLTMTATVNGKNTPPVLLPVQ